MATGNEEWVSALERMQTLGDISNTVKNRTDTFSAAQKALTKKVDDMKVQVAKIRQIMVVKAAAGKTATESCKRADRWLNRPVVASDCPGSGPPARQR